jgi:hypothetical protein
VINPNQIFDTPARRRLCMAGHTLLRVSRSRPTIGLLALMVGALMLPACSKAPPASSTGPSDVRKAAFTTPPFSTKEPERYQAVRVTTVTGDDSSPTQSNQVLVARDGEKRREEYSWGPSGQIVYLQIPAGRFVLLPARRIYADIGVEAERSIGSADDSSELSPDQLLNEAPAPATYENLGAETLAGRLTSKYRVVVLTGSSSPTETLIWIDETLGMPVRSEMTSQASGRSTKITMELKDVRLEVDERLFSWPSDYRKVEARTIFDLARKETKPATPKQ